MKKILVALDQSPRAPEVLAAALKLATSMDAKLLLFRAIPIPTDIPESAFAFPPTELEPLFERLAKEDLHEFSAQVPADLLLGVHTRFGSPWRNICEVAREEDVDLIVVGAHGYNAFERFIGTTAARVINHADRSVLVVRAQERFFS